MGWTEAVVVFLWISPLGAAQIDYKELENGTIDFKSCLADNFNYHAVRFNWNLCINHSPLKITQSQEIYYTYGDYEYENFCEATDFPSSGTKFPVDKNCCGYHGYYHDDHCFL